jgi:hypothetical protein
MSKHSLENGHAETLTVPSFSWVPRLLLAHVVRARPVASRLAGLLGRQDFPGRAEFASLRPATRFLIIAMAAWIGLVGLANVLALAAVELSTMSAPAWFGARASSSPGSEVRPSARYESILQRPLFSRSRQAAAADAGVVPPPPAASAPLDRGLTLKGVYINGTIAKAFLISAQNPLGVWVQVDEEIAGWRVVAVEPQQVLLNAQNERLEVALSAGSGTK